MADQDWRLRQLQRHFGNIGDIVRDRQAVQLLVAAAVAMSGQAERIGRVAGVGKKWQEMLLPAPRSGERAMDE